VLLAESKYVAKTTVNNEIPTKDKTAMAITHPDKELAELPPTLAGS
jgi:hypothetical protein